MSLAPTQSNDAAWRATRNGLFTASVFGKLLAEPKSLPKSIIDAHADLLPEEEQWKVLKSGPNKGNRVRPDGFATKVKEAMRENGIIVFGDTALSVIAAKAGERLAAKSDYSPSTRSTERGTLLEHGARILLGKYWTPIEPCRFQPLGRNSGASPDGVIHRGTETVDFKCPESFADVIQFQQLPDGDFEALESWDKTYAWQMMVQAKAAGVRFANLCYFTDRLPLIRITPEERMEVQTVIEYVAHKLGELTNKPWGYTFEHNTVEGEEVSGFAYAVKRYELTDERSALIDKVLAAAEPVCEDMMQSMIASKEQQRSIAA